MVWKQTSIYFWSYPITLSFFSSSINGDGAAEPVSDNLDEGEEENGAEEFNTSWPTAFTSASSDAEEADAPKQVQLLVFLIWSQV